MAEGVTSLSRSGKVADNEDIFHRIEAVYSSVLYLKCLRMPAVAKYDGSYDKFCHIAEEEGVTHYAEDDTLGRALRKSIENAK